MCLIIRSRLTLPQHDPYLVLLTFTEPEIKHRSNYQTKILQEKQFKVRKIQLKLKNASTFRKKLILKYFLEKEKVVVKKSLSRT